ncbi:probable tyrosyl-DNA phosphodiesterase isoform X2 [Thrips palmi]|uniref:Probable tyrosyl-DNA phosphodiesterase isoform X2 n=1 Tax=Thrips palmi TaxID=161013 RepID=A0A6P8YER9_THRPL|nr:probable tyrosyl-DNA phosphodiesterase isoform X2 [Thrips palmi]
MYDNSSSNASPKKKSRQECKFGIKCYRKNPAHFEEFEHAHLTDILPKWKDESSLPSGVDPEIRKNPVVLDQLKIVKKLGNSKLKVDSPKPTTSTAVASPKPSTAPTSKAEGETKAPINANSEKMAKMMKEATKHHGDVQAKLDAAAPYNFFLTSITDSPQTHSEPLTITFTELLDKSLGELESSLQINFMVELGWLLAQYFYTGNRFKPLTLLYGVEDEDLKVGANLPSNVTAVKVRPPTAFGHHHTKMSVLAYKDNSIRVIVSTANLVESDWENRTQGLWISPKLPQLPPDADTMSGDSPTQFKGDLVRYLSAYRLPQLQEWLGKIRRADFSSVRVCLVASVPGTHYGPDSTLWGHRRVCQLLKEHVSDPKITQSPWSKWPVIGQFSSIGSLGPDPNAWVCSELRASFSAPSKPMDHPSIKLIYPSLDNVKGSHDGLLGGGCLPYQKKTHEKQQWLTSYLHQWQSNARFRSRAMPHIKTYLRVSPCHSFLPWFLLTSANLSKAAWGSETKTKLPGPGLRILSYEAGVLFLPKFIVDDNVFNLEGGNSSSVSTGTGKRQDYPPFPLHYDLPLKTYKAGDSPFFYDIFNE